jgi:hypothetical protein
MIQLLGLTNGCNMNKIIELMSIFTVSVAVIIITAFVFGVPVSWLWNLFCPKILGFSKIDWIDGAVLYTLSRLLIGNFYYK